MKDAFGGILSLVFLVVFLVLVVGILGFIVNYTKAFKMKNQVIATIEQYKGTSSCFKTGGTCYKRIEEKAKGIGYSPTVLQCPSTGYKAIGKLFCASDLKSDEWGNKYYSVITQVDIGAPIISNILSYDIFQVHGDTRPLAR